MAKQALYEELDHAIDVLMADGRTPRVSEELSEVLMVAGELRQMSSGEFRARLRSDLEDQAMFIAAGREYRRKPQPAKVLQMPAPAAAMFSSGPATYPVSGRSFVVSLAMHAAMVALVLTSGYWVVTKTTVVNRSVVALVEPSEYILPASPKLTGGGGGGGDRDKVPAPEGKLPKASMEQITPPAMVIRNDHPQLEVAPSVVMPQVNMAMNLPNLGDPASGVSGPPSNGTGAGGGIGAGIGGGVGVGTGPGVGPGTGGGIGGGVFRVGGGVSAPRAIYSPDPDYTEEARKAKYQGTVVLWMIIDPDGRARNVKIARSLGMGLDEKAIAAVRNWKFEPAMKDGRPVAVQINVEVNFRLY